MKVRAAVKLSRNDALQAVKELTVSLLLTRGRADTTLVIKTERVINTDPIPPPFPSMHQHTVVLSQTITHTMMKQENPFSAHRGGEAGLWRD